MHLLFISCYFSIILILSPSNIYAENSEAADEDQEQTNISYTVFRKAAYFNNLAAEVLYESLDKSEEYAKEALRYAISPSDKANSYYNLAEVAYFRNDFDNAVYYYKNAMQIYEAYNYISKAADCYANTGIIHEIRGDYELALYDYEKALDKYSSINNQKGMAMILNNIGILYTTQGNYDKGFEYFQHSLKVEEDIGNIEGVASSLNNIGLVHRKAGRIEEAIEFYEESLRIKKEAGDDRGVAISSVNIGKAYEEINKYEKAYDYYNLALEKYTQLDDIEGISTALNNIGSIYFIREDYNLAVEYYSKSLQYRHSIGNRIGVASSLNNLGKSYLNLKKYDDALTSIKEGLELAQEIGAREQLAELYLSYSDINAVFGNHKEALKYYKLYKAECDTLINSESLKQIAELQTIYDTEKKENRIKLQETVILKNEADIKREVLRRNAVIAVGGLIFILAFFTYRMYRFRTKTNQILARQNQQLEELNATKNKFFSIVSHDLRNPFGTLVSVSDMLNTNYDKFDDEQKKSVVKTISKSAAMTHKLLENILTWATAQTGKISHNPEALNVTVIAKEVAEIYRGEAQKKNMSISVNMHTENNVMADKNMLETILRNLISNAIKFTNEDGKIDVNITENADYIVTEIADNGIGIEQQFLQQMFKIDTDYKKIGKSKNKGTGLGLLLCKEFVEINNGEIRVESELNKGTSFIFSLPLYKKNANG